MNDDPREVLALLNSLGFVGITAQQLKEFMKDLKLYRKVKERERQHRKDEIRKKIISKQQGMIQEILQEQNKEYDTIENIGSSGSSDICVDDSLVQVRIRCVSDEKENRKQTRPSANYLRTNEKLYSLRNKTEESVSPKTSNLPKISSDSETMKHQSNKYANDENDASKYLRKIPHTVGSKCKMQVDSKKVYREKLISLESRPKSAPNLSEHITETGSTQAQTISTRTSSNSRAKSFIRPWRLQPDNQKAMGIKKCDPVILYQKYQQEWKQMSVPGEAKHMSLRWAVREKMLGADPHPLPLPKKSSSMPILRKK